MICRVCKDDKSTFLMKSSGPDQKPCLICRKCDNKQRNDRYKKNPLSKARQDRIRAKVKRHTTDPSWRAYYICKWSRKSDKKKGRENDLTLEFTKRMIADGCSYCGETSLKMTLDRVDNSIGHLQTNVVPACIRCNYLRRDIPYVAWLILVPAVKEAVKKGLFGSWTGTWYGPKPRENDPSSSSV